MNSNLISISGIDGSGKSTQLDLLKKYYEDLGFKVIYLWSRGGSTPGINKLKSFLRLIAGKNLPPSGKSKKRDEMFKNIFIQYIWIYAAILDLLRIYAFSIRWNLLIGKKVICDRYIWDTLVDFKIMFPELEIERWLIWKILVKSVPIPFKQILLMIPIKTSIARCSQKFDPFPDSPEIREKRYSLYVDISNDTKFITIDAKQSSAAVFKQIIK